MPRRSRAYGTLCSSVLRIENSNYNKGGSEFFVATGGREGVLSDWSSAGGLARSGAAGGWRHGGILCRLWMEASRPIRNVHGGKGNNGTHFTHARLKVASHGIME